jgi:hypothetical protein
MQVREDAHERVACRSKGKPPVKYAIELLFAVLCISGIASYVFRRAFMGIFSPLEYKRAWTLLVLGTMAAYLCKFPALFAIVIAFVALYGAQASGRGVVGRIAVFLLLIVALPPIHFSIGGFGGINYLISVSHVRVLSLTLMAWAAVELVTTKRGPPVVSFLLVDLLVVGYQCLHVGLQFPSSTFTTDARMIVESLLDVVLPYFVVTRGLRSAADIRFAAGHMLLGLAFCAAVAIGEFVIQHNLYSGLQSVYEIQWQLTYTLTRDGLLRVQAVAPQPIILAFMMVFGLGLAAWLNASRWRTPSVAALLGAFFLALIATFSRGQWLAAGLLVLALIGLRWLTTGAFRAVLIGAVIAGVVVKVANLDALVISVLGSVFGSSDVDLSSIQYRQQLLDASLALIQQSPWLGVPNYAAQMQSLRQGEGIIDLVNTYVGILLDAGVVGLTLFLLPYVVVVHRLLGALRPAGAAPGGPGNRFAAAFVALSIACLFAIFTTSNWGTMPLLMTLLLALPVAWLGMSVGERNSSGFSEEMRQPTAAERRGLHVAPPAVQHS